MYTCINEEMMKCAYFGEDITGYWSNFRFSVDVSYTYCIPSILH